MRDEAGLSWGRAQAVIKTQRKPQPFPPGDLELGQPFKVAPDGQGLLCPWFMQSLDAHYPQKGHELGWGSCLLLGAVPSSQMSTGSSGENKSFIWEEESTSTAQHPPPWSCSWPEANSASLGQVSTRQQSCEPCAVAGAMFSRPDSWKASTTTWNQLIQLSANFQRPGNTGCFASTTHGNGHQLPSHSPCSLPYGIFRVVSPVLGNQPQSFFLRHTIIARHNHSLWRVMPTLVRAVQCFFFFRVWLLFSVVLSWFLPYNNMNQP